MKKMLLLAAAVLTLAACQQKKAETPEAAADTTQVAAALQLEGTVPAADGPGIKYAIALAADSTYTVTETYLEAENGKDKATEYKGKALEVKVDKKGTEVKGLKFPLAEGVELYLVQKDDSTYQLVNDQLEEAASGLNYSLKVVK